jgi:isoquinoline 1-oxidoreductase subunit beta
MRNFSPSRRRFLATTGGISVAVLAGGALEVYSGTAQAQAARPVNAWVTIGSDDNVTIKLGAAEMGQGVMTSLPLVVAEELDADWAKVRVEPVTHDPKTYGNPRTGGILYSAGSSSVQGYFDIMRRAGATARRVLVYTAAQHWSVPPSDVTTRPGTVLHQATGRRLRFGQVAGLTLVTEVPAVADADLKPRSAYRLIGKDVPRIDIPDKTRGATMYTIDVRVPGMVYAALAYAPVEGETVVGVEDADAKAVKGVQSVIRLDHAVAVIAERWHTARTARDRLKVQWTSKSPFRSADSDTDLQRDLAAARNLGQSGAVWSERGDAPGVIAASKRVVEAEYATDYAYHAQMEPLAAVAAVDADGKGAEIWFATQSQTVSLGVASEVLGTTPDRIRFHQLQMGGGFGRRTFFAREVLRDALLLSRELQRPVKIVWTREDDVKGGWFRPATAHKLRAALDASGNVHAWHHRIASPSIFGYVAPQRLKAANDRDLLIMEGSEISPYAIPNLRAEHLITERRARVSAWRGIGWGHDHFVSESFIDELAAAAGVRPVAYRRRLLEGNPRGLAVLDAVVAMSRFGNAPKGRAHGLSMSGYKDALGAGVAEISLDRATGAIHVHRFWAAVDCGLCLQPDNTRAQVEGGIVWGLSGALKERITIKGGEVQQSNFHDYTFLRRSEVPQIQVRILDSNEPPLGTGELGVPMTGAAVANAFFALTKARLRHMPFNPARVQEALKT